MGGMVAGAIFGDALTGIAADAVGSAIIGGGIAAATGGNVLQGALLGGVGGAIGGAVSGALGAGSAGATVAGAEGATMGVADVQNAINAYTDAGYTMDQATNFVAQATGSTPDAVTNALMSTDGTLQVAAQSPYALSGTSALQQVAGKAAGTAAQSALGGGTVGNLGSALANLAGANIAAKTAQDAAAAKEAAAAKANQQQLAMYNEQVQLQQPWMQAGQTALGQLVSGTQPGGQFATPFSTANMENVMPAFTFARDQGLNAMRNQMAAGGQALSTNAIQGAGTLASGLAGQFEGQAFNQYQAEQNALANKLQSLAGLGQSATQQTVGATGTAGANTAGLTLAAGGAQAQGITGAGQAQAGAITNVANPIFNSLASIFNTPVTA